MTSRRVISPPCRVLVVIIPTETQSSPEDGKSIVRRPAAKPERGQGDCSRGSAGFAPDQGDAARREGGTRADWAVAKRVRPADAGECQDTAKLGATPPQSDRPGRRLAQDRADSTGGSPQSAARLMPASPVGQSCRSGCAPRALPDIPRKRQVAALPQPDLRETSRPGRRNKLW